MEAKILLWEKNAIEVNSAAKLIEKINEILTNVNCIVLTKSDIDALQNAPTDINPFKITENYRIYRTLNKGTKKAISKIGRQLSKRKLTKEKEHEIKRSIKEYEQTRRGGFCIELSKTTNSNNPYGEKILLRTGYYCSRPDSVSLELIFLRKADPSDIRATCKKLSLYVQKKNNFIQKSEYQICFILKLNNGNDNIKNGKNNK